MLVMFGWREMKRWSKKMIKTKKEKTGLVFGPLVMSRRGDFNNSEEFIDRQVKKVLILTKKQTYEGYKQFNYRLIVN